jgi:hypothetical protein
MYKFYLQGSSSLKFMHSSPLDILPSLDERAKEDRFSVYNVRFVYSLKRKLKTFGHNRCGSVLEVIQMMDKRIMMYCMNETRL